LNRRKRRQRRVRAEPEAAARPGTENLVIPPSPTCPPHCQRSPLIYHPQKFEQRPRFFAPGRPFSGGRRFRSQQDPPRRRTDGSGQSAGTGRSDSALGRLEARRTPVRRRMRATRVVDRHGSSGERSNRHGIGRTGKNRCGVRAPVPGEVGPDRGSAVRRREPARAPPASQRRPTPHRGEPPRP
jgi:hypothetical protein